MGSKNDAAYNETYSKPTNLLQSFENSKGNTYIPFLLLIRGHSIITLSQNNQNLDSYPLACTCSILVTLHLSHERSKHYINPLPILTINSKLGVFIVSKTHVVITSYRLNATKNAPPLSECSQCSQMVLTTKILIQ